MRIFLPYFKPHLKESLLGPLFKWFEAIFQLLVPFLIAQMIDNGIQENRTLTIYLYTALLIIIGVLGVAFAIVAQYYASKSAIGFASQVRQAFFKKVHQFSYEELSAFGTDSLIVRMTSDINQMQQGVNLFFRLFLRSPFMIIGTLVATFWLHPQMGQRFAIITSLLFLVIFIILVFSLPLYHQVQERMDHLTTQSRDFLSGLRVLRSFNQSENQVKHFKFTHRRLTHQQIRVSYFSNLLNPLTFVLLNLGIVWIIYSGGPLVDQGVLSQGVIVALVNYLTQLLVELVKFAHLIITMSRAIVSSRRVASVLSADSSRTVAFKTNNEAYKSSSQTTVQSVELNQLSYQFPHAKQFALSPINMTFHAGQTIGIIGGTGSGKSTLVHLLAQIYQPTQGNIYINEQNVHELPHPIQTKIVASVLQEAVLFKGTLSQNLKMGNPDASDELIQQALTAAQASDFVHQLPNGLNTKIDQFGRNFSGGQRQRIAIARALIKQSPILILDDALSALDYQTGQAVLSALKRWPSTQLLFQVSQRISTIQHADMIMVLHQGRLIDCASHNELIKRCPIYQEIAISQGLEVS
ncbi:ABC transporter ATP-binding protein [Atopobacter phocae]|uniref:ABC transporter ATP-binding protein n=1 Tax=Atopobacter phocae TaxID=136492 RepID=UPI00047045E6|nr:ABC transporter ATP-binding protein [Atopobacter phocae]